MALQKKEVGQVDRKRSRCKAIVIAVGLGLALGCQIGPLIQSPFQASMMVTEGNDAVQTDSMMGMAPQNIGGGLLFNTLFGGSDRDSTYWVEVDTQGDLFIMGWTLSTDLPTTPGAFCETTCKGGFQTNYLAKFNANASRLLYCTYLEAPGDVMLWASSMELDSEGCPWVVGYVNASCLPTTEDAFCSTYSGGRDGYLMKINGTHPTVEYCTYIGGTSDDSPIKLAVAENGMVTVCGSTTSDDFPTSEGAYCRTFSGMVDGFVLRLSPKERMLGYSTFLGGTRIDVAAFLQVDSTSKTTILCRTTSTDFPTTEGAYSRTNTGTFNFALCRLDESGERLDFSTYLGIIGEQNVYDFALDVDGSVWVCGGTDSEELPTNTSSLQPELSGDEDDGFLARLAPDGTEITYCTYFGRVNNDFITSIVMTGRDRPLVVGLANGTEFSFPRGAIQPTRLGMHDVFLAWFDLSRNRLLNGTYLGGENIEYNSYLMPRVENGSVYVVGATASFTFPTTEGCYHTRLDGESDGFVAAIRFEETPWELPTAPLNLSAAPQDGGAILRWEPPTFDSGWPIDRYRVFAGSIPGEEVFLKDVSDDEGCLVTGLVNGREYSFRVTAVTIVGEGPSSDSVQVMPIRHPGPPVAFEAEAGMGSATLRWSPPTDTRFSPVLGFHLFRGTEPSSLGLISVLGNVTGFLDEGLDPGRLYYYQVRAFNLAGNGTMSNLVQVVPLGLPTEPLLLKAVPGDGEVRLTWRPPLNDGGSLVLGYRLLKAVTGGDLWEYEVLGAVTERTDAQVVNGISYDYALVAFTAVGDGPLSKVVTARPEGAPGIPLNFTAMGSDGKVTLSWDAPLTDGGAAIIGYHILRGEDGGELRLHNEIGPLTICIDENVLNGVRYAYLVCAVNSHGEGPRTPLTSCVPLGLPGPPTWITGHAIDGTAELSWSPPESDGGSPVLGYKLYQGGSPDLENLIAELPTADTGHEVAGLTNGVTYRYWISAFTAVGEGPAGGPVLMVPLGPPGPPRDLTATRGDSKVTLEWQPPADDGGSAVTGYVLCREDSSGAMRVIATLGPVLSHVDVGLFNGRTYNYSVAAVNAVGNGTQAGIVAAVPAGLPGMPLGVTASVKGSTVSLRWDAPESDGGSPVLRFLVLRGSSPDDLSPLGNVTGCFTYEDAGVERGRTYFYAVVAVNDVGQGPISLVEVDVRKGEKSPGVTAFATGLALAIVHCAHRASRRPMPSRQGPRV